jgi:hypothetical protein
MMNTPSHSTASALLVCTILLVSACAQLPKGSPPDANANSIRTIDNATNNNQSLLEFAGSFVDLPEEAQKKQALQFNQVLTSNKGDLKNKMKLAMIYALPNSKVHDTGRAQTLLDELLREKLLDSELKTMATLLRDHIIESNKLSQKIREEQKRADSAQQKLDASQQKIGDLERKLLDLKNIEKAMVDRDTGTRK